MLSQDHNSNLYFSYVKYLKLNDLAFLQAMEACAYCYFFQCCSDISHSYAEILHSLSKCRQVPGKSAQECFDRVNGSFQTPPQPLPRSRGNRSNLSPISNFSLSGSKPIQRPIPLAKKLSSRKKNLVAQKTARHLLRKHCVNDQNREVDHFSVLETSPTTLAVELPEASSPIPLNCLSSPLGFFQKCSGGSSSAHKKMLSRFKPLAQAHQPSPEVLKRIKNMALHEKYIDQLHTRDARREYVASSSAAARVSKNEGEMKTGVLKAAKTALMSEAKEFISHFQHLRANPHGKTDTDDEVEEEDE